MKIIKKFLSSKLVAILLTCVVSLWTITGISCSSGKGNNSSSSSSVNNSSNSSSNQSEQIDLTKFTQTLQTVLSSSYYNDLIYIDSLSSDLSCPISRENPKYMAIPYGFLESEGFDVQKIKNKELKSITSMYSEGNDLFIEIMVEVKGTPNYLASYVVKYSLTEQEMRELKLLFVNTDANNKATYYQAPFFVQQLSYDKTAQLVSKGKITEDSLNAAIEYMNEKNYISPSTFVSFVGFEDTTDLSLKYFTFIIHSNCNGLYTKQLVQATVNFATIKFVNNINNLNGDIMINTNYTSMILNDANREAFNYSKKTVTCYSSNVEVFDKITNHYLRYMINNLFE